MAENTLVGPVNPAGTAPALVPATAVAVMPTPAQPVVAAAQPATESWPRKHGGAILTASVTILIALIAGGGGLYLSMQSKIDAVSETVKTNNANHQEQMKVQAEQVKSNDNLLVVEVERLREELKSLRDKASQADLNFANANGTNGRFETALNTNTAEVVALRADVAAIHKQLAAVTQLGNGSSSDICGLKTKCEKILEDVVKVRERLAGIEADQRRTEKLSSK
jgi:hypothetical protein